MGTEVSCSSPHHSSTPVRNSLLGASLHSFCCTRVVPNLTAKLQGHRGVAFIHCQDGHLVLGGALNHSQGADLRLKAKVMVSAARVPPDPNTPWLTLQREKGREPGTTALGTGERRDTTLSTARGVRWVQMASWGHRPGAQQGAIPCCSSGAAACATAHHSHPQAGTGSPPCWTPLQGQG